MKIYKKGDKIVIDGENELIFSKNKNAFEIDAPNIEVINQEYFLITNPMKDQYLAINKVLDFIQNGNYKLENGDVKSINS